MIKYFLSFLLSTCCMAHPFEDPASWHRRHKEITSFLKKTKIRDKKDLSTHLEQQKKTVPSCVAGATYLVGLEQGLRGVLKTPGPEEEYFAYAEDGAYRASLFLGFPYIPPTVIRKINGKTFSLQLFVDTTIDLLKKGVYAEIIRSATTQQKEDLALFCFVFGHWDFAPHNMLAVKTKKERLYLVSIDHSEMNRKQYVSYGDVPFIRSSLAYSGKKSKWGDDFPFDQERVIRKTGREKFIHLFGPQSESFFVPRGPYHYAIFRGAVWRKVTAGRKHHIFKAFTETVSEKTLHVLEKLTIRTLRSIFSGVPAEGPLSKEDSLSAILERRNQVLDFFKKHPRNVRRSFDTRHF